MVMTAKPWKPPERSEAFRYYITDNAVMAFRAVAPEFAGLTDESCGRLLDSALASALAARKPQAISIPAERVHEPTMIAEIKVKHDLNMVGVLAAVRPNSYPPIPTVGGPGVPQLGLMSLVSMERAAQNMATGKWNVCINRPFADALSKLQFVQVDGSGRNVNTTALATSNPSAEPATTTEEKDVESSNNTGRYSKTLEYAASIGPKSTAGPTKDVVIPAGKMANGRRGRRAYSEAYKLARAQQVIDGASVATVAKEHDLTETALRRWTEAARKKTKRSSRRTDTPTSAQTSETRQERINFARQQFELNPDLACRGKDSLAERMLDRFGQALDSNVLLKIRDEVRKEKNLPAIMRGGNLAEAQPSAKPKMPSTAEIREIFQSGQQYSCTDIVMKICGREDKAIRDRVSIILSELCRRKELVRVEQGVYRGTDNQSRKPAASALVAVAPNSEVAALSAAIAHEKQCALAVVEATERHAAAKKATTELLAEMQRARSAT